jgi:hypothetical protein
MLASFKIEVVTKVNSCPPHYPDRTWLLHHATSWRDYLCIVGDPLESVISSKCGEEFGKTGDSTEP